MRRVLRWLAVLALVGAAGSAAAFTRETTTPGSPGTGVCLSWGGSRSKTYVINPEGLVNSGCSTADARTAVANAFLRWATASQGGSGCPDFSVGGGAITSQKAIGNDGVNLVVFRRGKCGTPAATPDNCWSHGGQTIALTTTSFDPRTGEIFDADIELFATDGAAPTDPTRGHYFTCVAPGAPTCNNPPFAGCSDIDIEAVVGHEAGHMIGLDHPCGDPNFPAPYNAACSAPAPLMKPTVGSASERDLTADDVAGICAIYPKGAATVTCAPTTNETSSGCSSASPGGVAGLIGAAAFAALVLRRRRR
jgi:uncharacterized protein (TIGR03382 family)